MNYKRLKKKVKSFTGVSVILFLLCIFAFWIYASFRLSDEDKNDEDLLSDSNLASIESFFVEGKIQFKNERYRQANEMFQQILNLDNKNFSALEWSARCQEKMEKKDIAQKLYIKVVTINDKQFYSHYRLAILYFLNMNWEEAKKHAGILLSNSDMESEANAIMAGCLLFQKDEIKAQEHFSKIQDHSTDTAKYIASCFLTNSKKYTEAIAKTKAVSVGDFTELANLKLAEVYFLQKNNTDAELILEKIQYSQYHGIKLAYLQLCLQYNYIDRAERMIVSLVSSNLNLELSQTFATMLYQYDQDDYVFSYVMDLLKKQSKNPILNFVVMQVFLKKHAFLQAEVYIPNIIDNAKDESLVLKAYKVKFGLLFIKYNWQNALDCALEITKLYPQEEIGYVYQGQVHLAQDKLDEALKIYHTGLAKTENKAFFKTSIANVYLLQKEWKKAGLLAKEMISNDENVDRAKTILATVYLQIGQQEKAHKMYEELFNKSEKNGVAANNLAMLITNNGGDLEYAEKLAKLATNKVNSPLVWDTLAWVYVKRKKFQEAKEILEPLIENFPENIDINYHYATLMKELGFFAIATEKFNVVVNLDSESEYVQQALREIKKISDSQK